MCTLMLQILYFMDISDWSTLLSNYKIFIGSTKRDGRPTSGSVDGDIEVRTRTKLSDTQMGGSTSSLLSDHSDVQSIKSAASERALQQTSEPSQELVCP